MIREGYTRVKINSDDRLWFGNFGKLRGPAIKGFSRRFNYKKVISNPKVIEGKQRMKVKVIYLSDGTAAIYEIFENNQWKKLNSAASE